jgi:hypothetical protein
MRLTIFTPRFNGRWVALVTSKELARALARCIVALGREQRKRSQKPPTRIRFNALLIDHDE